MILTKNLPSLSVMKDSGEILYQTSDVSNVSEFLVLASAARMDRTIGSRFHFIDQCVRCTRVIDLIYILYSVYYIMYIVINYCISTRF